MPKKKPLSKLTAPLGSEELKQRAFREGRIPGLDPKVWRATYDESVEPLVDWWDKPRVNKFMDALSVATDLIEPQKGSMNTAALLPWQKLLKPGKKVKRSTIGAGRQGKELSTGEWGEAGYRKSLEEGRGFSTQQYPHTSKVRVELEDDEFIDEVKGLSEGHALWRASQNWPDAVSIGVLPPVRKSAGTAKKSYQEGTMAMRSKASFEPGTAEAYQSPYAVGPIGGMGSGNMFGYMQSMMERQMKLKEAMAKAQLQAMHEDRKAAQEQLEQARKRSSMNQTMFRKGLSPQMFGKAESRPWAPTGKQWRMASDPTMSHMPGADQAIMDVNQWLGPQTVAQMMMQKGKNWADVIRQGSATAGALQGGQPPVDPYIGGGHGGRFVGNRGGNTSQFGPVQPIQGRTAEKGGRVPKTGTYKLHKDEIVLNKQQSDMMFPRAPKPSKGKAIKGYEDGTDPLWGGLGSYVPGAQLPEAERGELFQRILGSVKDYLTEGADYQQPEEEIFAPAAFVPPTEGVGDIAYAEQLANAPMAPMQSPMAPQTEQEWPLDIKGLSIGEAPISERRMINFGGQQIPSRPETDQKTVKQYTLTSPKETEDEELARNKADAAKFGRDARYYQRNADAMLAYASENPSPDTMRKYQEQQTIADRYQKRADKAQSAAEKMQDQAKAAKTAKELKEIEQGGLEDRAIIGAQSEIFKSAEEARQSAMEGVQNAMKTFNDGKYDKPDVGFVSDVMASLNAQTIFEVARSTGMPPEDVRDTIYDLAKAEATGVTQDGTPISPGKAIAIIQMLLSGGNALE